jgi:hypothetical protein
MNEKRLKLELMIAGAIFIAIIVFIISEFVGLNLGAENCWDNYSTEEQAIINCEGVNK